MGQLGALLPPSTNAAYRGHPAAAWFLGLAALLTIVPGLIHSFAPDGGAVGIAGLDLGDRRDLVVGVFRWQGATQLAFGIAMLAVALRYRSLTPLLLALLVLERGLMALHGWGLNAGDHHPPEHYGSLAGVVLGVVFLALSLQTRPT